MSTAPFECTLISISSALAVQSDKPFRGLEMFGTGFLSKFQSAECAAPLLEELTFIDTPGVLSGEKQRIGRAYDFVKVCGWFAERSDLILFLFDAHKLDISDEFKRAIESLRVRPPFNDHRFPVIHVIFFFRVTMKRSASCSTRPTW